VTSVKSHFSGRDVEFSGREDVAVTSHRLFHSRLVHAWIEGGDLKCDLTGLTDGPSPLTVWHNDDQNCRREVRHVDAIDGFRRIEGLGKPCEQGVCP